MALCHCYDNEQYTLWKRTRRYDQANTQNHIANVHKPLQFVSYSKKSKTFQKRFGHDFWSVMSFSVPTQMFGYFCCPFSVSFIRNFPEIENKFLA